MPATKRLLRPVLIVVGSLGVALGVIGAFLPLVPTTPFLLLAAACYARSSPRLLRWLNNNRLFGAYIRNWRAGRGIPRRDKIIAIGLIWLTIGASAIWFTSLLWVRILLIGIAAMVTAHLLWMPTYSSEERAPEDAMS
jgi:uncharacterized membrane protein YbaN (DUF454 family)